MAKTDIYRVELYHVAAPGMATSYWKILRDIIRKDKAIAYANESVRHLKGTARVVHIYGTTQKIVYQSDPEHSSMLYFDTLEGRAKDILFKQYLENNDQIEDLPFMRVFEFQNMLDTADGKVLLYDLTVKLRKELH